MNRNTQRLMIGYGNSGPRYGNVGIGEIKELIMPCPNIIGARHEEASQENKEIPYHEGGAHSGCHLPLHPCPRLVPRGLPFRHPPHILRVAHEAHVHIQQPLSVPAFRAFGDAPGFLPAQAPSPGI